MPERFDLSYDVTREDWLAVNEACMRESPAWKDAMGRHRRAMRRQALWEAPFRIVGAAFLIGRTHGMYMEGAALGAAFAAFLFFTLLRVNAVEKSQKAELEHIRRMDLSAHVAAVTIAMHEDGTDQALGLAHDGLAVWSLRVPVAGG